MTSRSLLHVTKVEAFKTWLIEQGHDCRDPVGYYQLLQIRLKGHTAWWALYRRERMPEHVSVTKPLIPIVREWLKSRATPPQSR